MCLIRWMCMEFMIPQPQCTRLRAGQNSRHICRRKQACQDRTLGFTRGLRRPGEARHPPLASSLCLFWTLMWIGKYACNEGGNDENLQKDVLERFVFLFLLLIIADHSSWETFSFCSIYKNITRTSSNHFFVLYWETHFQKKQQQQQQSTFFYVLALKI